ncbi:MAG: SET domain-containing protein-lysine N-methyltransferase [Gammaproteobacteria bacterium]|nr:SET domain-containing protein-lysine N-methyltransferase [Gammaproteobacteria bacterium]
MSSSKNNAGVHCEIYVGSSEIHGKGVFAGESIKKNTSVGFLEGVPTKRNGMHVLWIDDSEGWRVTNKFRFLNHSSSPNLEIDVAGEKPQAIALRTIKRDEELTFDYGWE